jgi:hypothetical protein
MAAYAMMSMFERSDQGMETLSLELYKTQAG